MIIWHMTATSIIKMRSSSCLFFLFCVSMRLMLFVAGPVTFSERAHKKIHETKSDSWYSLNMKVYLSPGAHIKNTFGHWSFCHDGQFGRDGFCFFALDSRPSTFITSQIIFTFRVDLWRYDRVFLCLQQFLATSEYFWAIFCHSDGATRFKSSRWISLCVNIHSHFASLYLGKRLNETRKSKRRVCAAIKC